MDGRACLGIGASGKFGPLLGELLEVPLAGIPISTQVIVKTPFMPAAAWPGTVHLYG